MNNNAANNIEAKSRSLRDLMKDRRYSVGYFQREYKWDRIHIEELFDDLERSFFDNFDVIKHTFDDIVNYSSYYMGPIVLFRDGASYSIVDGQQRLTSFTLILIFLKHLQNIVFKDSPEKIQNLNEYIYSKSFGKETYNLDIDERKLVLGKLFKEEKITGADLQNESSINISDRYKDIIELFPGRLRKKELLPFFIIWMTEKLVFIEITTQTDESAYTIFETMNDRGLNLTPSEMLKSYLLASIRDESKIKLLDTVWKGKINKFKHYSNDEDQDFFKAWLRAKYAITIRDTKAGAKNEDFEKIGTRFHSWVQRNSRKLYLKSPNDYYLFVESDFNFYSDIYLQLCQLQTDESLPENELKLMTVRGVTSSLSYPLILSSIQKTDENAVIDKKIEITIKYLDSFGVYRLLLDQSITQSSIRYYYYNLIKDVRDMELEKLRTYYTVELEKLSKQFTERDKSIPYIPYDEKYAKFLLSRFYIDLNHEVMFKDIFFQRKKDSFIIYQIQTSSDVDNSTIVIPSGLKNIFTKSLCTYCVIPRSIATKLRNLDVISRIKFLEANNYLPFSSKEEGIDLKEYFMERNKKMKEYIKRKWKLL